MSEIIPIFYDSSSFKSILTVAKPSEYHEGGPVSIVTLAKEAGLKKCVFVSKNFSSFIDAYKNLKKENIELIFGVEFVMCDDAKNQSPESQANEHKIIILMDGTEKGYQDLIKIYTACHSNPDNKYYIQRFDYKQLKPLWSKHLIMALPFFDSFIAKNLLQFGAAIVPDLSFCKPIILREINSGLPHEGIINTAIDKYNADKVLEEIKTKTIYHHKYEDFRAYSVYRAIMNNAQHQKPEMEHFGSKNFNFEDWKKLCNVK